jgi:hypothetical protein
MQLGNGTNATNEAWLRGKVANDTDLVVVDVDRLAASTAALAKMILADYGIDSSVVTTTAILTTLISLCVLCVSCVTCSFLKASRRQEENRLMVQIADEAPIDDRDEHESEQHMDPRLPAPGDSDAEDAEDGAARGTKNNLAGRGGTIV